MCIQRPFFLLLLLLLGTGCATSSKLNKKSEYLRSTNHVLKGEATQALEKLPETEKSGFITLTEKTWLGLVAGEPLPSTDLVKMGRKLPTKETVVISDELSHYFYSRTPEGYYPAEHEVIFFHLVSAMVFLRGENLEAAEVEARKAAFYLQDDFVSHSGGFDSAQFRVWLAGIWASLGFWEKAQVDLRNAAKISDEFSWAGELAKKKKAPKVLSIVLQGIGAEPVYDPKGFSSEITGSGALKFKEEKPAKLLVVDSRNVRDFPQQSTMIENYHRHLKRNDTIRDVLEKSDYMAKSSLVHTGGAIAKASGTVAAGTIIVAGVAIGVAVFAAITYAAAQASTGGGELVALGVTLGYGAYKGFQSFGKNLKKSIDKTVNKGTKEALDLSKTYRYVRYIPSRVFMHNSQSPLSLAVEQTGDQTNGQVSLIQTLKPFYETRSKDTRVLFYYTAN